MYGAPCAPGASKHYCFDEHDELHFALARGRGWRGSVCRTVTHRPDCRGADEKMRLNGSVMLRTTRDAAWPSGGSPNRPESQFQLLFPTSGAAGFRLHLSIFRNASPLRRLAPSVTDWLTPAALSFTRLMIRSKAPLTNSPMSPDAPAASRSVEPDRRRTRLSSSLTSSSIADLHRWSFCTPETSDFCC
jgi:hypothetical protein